MGHCLFLSFDARRHGHAWRLDNVHDVDADERALLVQFRRGFPTYVVGHDGGHDDAIRCAHVS